MSHHIIPKHVFKKSGLAFDDSQNNRVNLLLKDHILAHYYLYKCSKDEDCKLDNFKAIQCLTEEHWNEDELLSKLDFYQNRYEQAMLSIKIKKSKHI